MTYTPSMLPECQSIILFILCHIIFHFTLPRYNATCIVYTTWTKRFHYPNKVIGGLYWIWMCNSVASQFLKVALTLYVNAVLRHLVVHACTHRVSILLLCTKSVCTHYTSHCILDCCHTVDDRAVKHPLISVWRSSYCRNFVNKSFMHSRNISVHQLLCPKVSSLRWSMSASRNHVQVPSIWWMHTKLCTYILVLCENKNISHWMST